MAIEPDRIMADMAKRAHQGLAGEPPTLLRHPPGVGGPLSPVRQADELAAIHHDWAQTHATEQAPTGGGAPGGSLGARVRARLTRALVRTSLPAQKADRYLIGDLIRAVDALARRTDEIGDRLVALEALVDELVVVTGEDLTRIRATLDRQESSQPAAGRRHPPAEANGG